MKLSDFEKLSEEVQKEFLERGGTVEYPKAANSKSLGYMRWGYSGTYGTGDRVRHEKGYYQQKNRRKGKKSHKDN